MPTRTHLVLGVALSAVLSLSANARSQAQAIEVESLDAAKAFAPGIDIPRGLRAESWQGTSADRAARLLRDLPTETSHPIVRDMLRRVVLSGLVPPNGAGPEFERTRIRAAQALATPDEYAQFATRNPAAQDPALRAEALIAAGDLMAACEISDTITQGRGENSWIRLRAACHEARGETASAELARDLLRDRGEEPMLMVPEPPQGFWIEAMVLDDVALLDFMTERAGEPEPPELSEPSLLQDETEAQLTDTLKLDASPQAEPETDPFAMPEPLVLFEPRPDPEPEPEPGPRFDLDAALADDSLEGTARLFLLARDGDARAVSEFVSRAVAEGLNPDRVLSRIPALLDPTEMAMVDLPLFARFAVVTRDIPMIQALFEASEDPTIRERLALASDSLGNGFIARPLGSALEIALAEDAPGAAQDVLMALALGADLTEPVEALLTDSLSAATVDPHWVGVDHAIDRGARAESLLRLADQIATRQAEDSWTLYRTIRRLRDAGFAETAGQLAAYEYLRGL